MVYLAEQGLARLADGSGGLTLDPAWQEMLNHATHRVNQVNLVILVHKSLSNVKMPCLKNIVKFGIANNVTDYNL